MIIDVNSDYDIIKWKRNGEEWKIAPLEELIDCFDKYTWIPVSERSPEVTGRYIVTNTMTGAWEIDIDMWLGEWRDNEGVVAWMDMPELYEEENGDKSRVHRNPIK